MSNQEFFDLVGKGAEVFAHPDTLAEFDAKAPDFMRTLRRLAELHETHVIANKWLEPGKLYAVPKSRPFEFPLPAVEHDWLRDYMYERLFKHPLGSRWTLSAES